MVKKVFQEVQMVPKNLKTSKMLQKLYILSYHNYTMNITCMPACGFLKSGPTNHSDPTVV